MSSARVCWNWLYDLPIIAILFPLFDFFVQMMTKSTIFEYLYCLEDNM